MSLGLHLVAAAMLATAAPACSWAHPGANPYRGDPVRALADFDLPAPTRRKLGALMAAHRTTDVVAITRDDIVGTHDYGDLREMHSGGGRVCHGAVDRSAWSPARRERGLVYCADDACVIVPTICNNVSLVSRKPDRAALADDMPIDIAPAAGPPSAPPVEVAAAAPTDSAPLDFMPPAAGGGSGGADSPGDTGPGLPITGSLPCCDTVPIFPIVPLIPVVPPLAAVPEAPTWALLVAGAALFAVRRGQRRRTQARSRSGCACAGHGESKNASTIATSTAATVGGFQRGA